MASGIKVEDRLEGASNFFSWKIQILTLLEELELDSYVEENKNMPEEEPEK